jgi:hypothetical protein
MTYWWWYERPNPQKALGTGILMGSALGVRANAIFIIPILFITIFPLSFLRDLFLDGSGDRSSPTAEHDLSLESRYAKKWCYSGDL